MKVGIITFHAALNYGSALQAYALQEYLVSLGHEAEVIDFRSAAQRRLYPAPVCFNSVYNAKHSLRRLLSGWGEIASMREKRRGFDSFLTSYLRLTPKTYHSESQLHNEDWSSFDAIVAGSDQIWNLAAIDSSLAYFIDFADEVVKISYAPSLGPDPERTLSASRYGTASEVKRLLSGFKAVSVREQGSADALVSRGFLPDMPEVLPDPVLLHDAGFYRAMACSSGDLAAGKAPAGNYVLFYSPGRKNSAAEMLADAAASGMLSEGASSVLPQEKRKIILKVSDGALAGRSVSLKSGLNERIGTYKEGGMLEIPCGPAGFVSLVDGASCTVGTSFHLMVFSMLFGKDFWCPDAASDSRKVQLLDAIGLPSDRTFFPFSDPSVHQASKTALSEMRQKSEIFLSEALKIRL